MWRKLRRSTKPCMRPVKGGAARRRRLKVQRQRLVAAGLATDAEAQRMGVGEIRELHKKVPTAKK